MRNFNISKYYLIGIVFTAITCFFCERPDVIIQNQYLVVDANHGEPIFHSPNHNQQPFELEDIFELTENENEDENHKKQVSQIVNINLKPLIKKINGFNSSFIIFQENKSATKLPIYIKYRQLII